MTTSRSSANVVELDAGWLDGLAKKNNQILGDERNVLRALRTAPALVGLFRYNTFALVIEFAGSVPWRATAPGDVWTDDDAIALMSYLQESGIPVRGKNVITDCVSLVAKDVEVHPVCEYLDALTWDRTLRLDDWLSVYLGADGERDYLRAIGRKWMISAIARIREPGCQADSMVVLDGPQGIGKSRAARALARRPEWFADSVGDVHHKDSAIQLRGKWIIEQSELAALRRAEVEAIKAYVSRPQDVYRPPYGRCAVTVPRQCIFIGTTNEQEYLRDKTGNRRFWPVRCRAIDLEALERDCDQLWAEAVNQYEGGASWHLNTEENALAVIEQESRMMVTELEANVEEFLAGQLDRGITEVTTRDVFRYALNLESDSERYAEQTARLGAQVSAAMTRCGWYRDKTVGRGQGKRTRYVYRNREGGNREIDDIPF